MTTTRQRKTPRARAEEQLAAAERAVDRLTVKVATTRGDLEQLEAEWEAAVRRRDHYATHPDLDTTTTTTTSTGDTQ